MLILCSPHNPGGRVWTRDELEAVADSCMYVNEWTGWRGEDHPGESLRNAVFDGLPPPDGSTGAAGERHERDPRRHAFR